MSYTDDCLIEKLRAEITALKSKLAAAESKYNDAYAGGKEFACLAAERLLEVERLKGERLIEERQVLQGHDSPCYYCQGKCNSFAGNPREWPVALCHEDEPGVVKWHHVGCVSDRLRKLAAAESACREKDKVLDELYGYLDDSTLRARVRAVLAGEGEAK